MPAHLSRTTRFVTAGGVAVILAAGLTSGHAAAWGNGCLDGIQFPNEQTYYTYLAAHPGAAVDVCTTTTTVRSTTSTSSSTSTTTVPSSSSTAVTTSSTVPPVTTPSTDSSTPSRPPFSNAPTTAATSPPPTAPQPGAMCATPPPSDGATSSGCWTGSTPRADVTPPGSPRATSVSSLPSTGSSTTGYEAAVAAFLLAAGAALMFITRR